VGRYKKKRFNDSDEQMKKYVTVMSAEGLESGIPFRFDGTIANTQHAHRVIQYFQEEKGAAVADLMVKDLYGQYFTEAKHPSSHETLMHAALAASIPEDEAKRVVDDESVGMMEMKMLEREQRSNGIDAVPNITIEGKRRDVTIEGARSVEEFEKELQKIAKETK
jgi:predicted DsbA family dithiol-disulfide isomerase